MRTLRIITNAAFGLLFLANFASAQEFKVSSATFRDNSTHFRKK
jgi:hypothetical protein